MSLNATIRSLAAGAVAAIVVVGAYAWGHSASPAAASTPAPSAPSAAVAATPDGNGISVDGIGRVTGTPNLLRLQTSIDVTKPDVTAAMNEASATMAKVQATLKSDAVADADLQTSGLSVQPDYDYSGKSPVLKGYQVSENLSVVLRDLSTAGSIINDIAQAGGNELRMGSATLDIDGDDALVAQARQKAFADAKAKADAYAKAAGRSLGKVLSISESTSGQPQVYYAQAAPAASNGLAVPVQAGSQDVTVTVSVVWALSS